jgi:two-component system CheB/CheR fusion protein
MTAEARKKTSHRAKPVSAPESQRGLQLRKLQVDQLEAQNEALLAEQARLLKVLRETERRGDEFLTVLGYQLRNPLAPIRHSLFVLTRSGTDIEQRRLAEQVIERQVTHLTRLIDDLLDVTPVSRGTIQLQCESVEIRALVRNAVEEHRPTFEAAGIHLDVELDPEDLWVDGDPARLAQVLGSLLSNAKRFTPAGGAVVVRLVQRSRNVAFVVRDDGVGILAARLEHIFEPFRQAPDGARSARGGLGLGLALVKRIVELHGGTVSVHSDGPGLGTEAAVVLPLDVPPAQRTVYLRPPPGTKRHVLVIEDNVDSAEALKQLMMLGGHEVWVAHDGPEGLRLARAFRPDVVICDISLPGMNGYEVARAFRADEDLRGTYLVAISGYAGIEDRRGAAVAGFNRHMTKPSSPEMFERLLDEAPIACRTPETNDQLFAQRRR